MMTAVLIGVRRREEGRGYNALERPLSLIFIAERLL